MPIAAFPKCFLDALVIHKTMSPEEWVRGAKRELDIDGLEFFWGFVPPEESEQKKIRAIAESLGLSIPMLCYSPDFTQPDPAERRAEIAKQKEVIRGAAALGSKYCRVLSGQRRPIPRADGVRYAAECIGALIPFAAEHKVTLILENHYKDNYWEFPEFAQKLDVFLELLNAIPRSEWFGVNYDPSNAIIAGDDPIAVLEAVKDRVVTMHASDRYFEGGTIQDLRKLEAHPQKGYAPILKHGIIGRGLNDYDRIFSILKAAGFNGWISIEDGENAALGWEHLRLSAEFLRKKMAQHGLR